MKYKIGYTFDFNKSTFKIVDSYDTVRGLMFRAEKENGMSEHFTLAFLTENNF